MVRSTPGPPPRRTLLGSTASRPVTEPGQVQWMWRERHRHPVQRRTVWSDDTLLARQIALNRDAEARDGVRRHFQVGWEEVARANPTYGRHVQDQIERL